MPAPAIHIINGRDGQCILHELQPLREYLGSRTEHPLHQTPEVRQRDSCKNMMIKAAPFMGIHEQIRRKVWGFNGIAV